MFWKKSIKNNLNTDFYKGETIPLSSYPRPQFRRENSVFLNLNGLWDCRILKKEGGNDIYSGKILVPFPPESSLSGVNHILQPDEQIIYTTNIEIDTNSPLYEVFHTQENEEEFQTLQRRVFLNIDACDYFTKIVLNGEECFNGPIGYIPQTIDVTQIIHLGTNTITIYVDDPTTKGLQPIGKQSLKPSGIFYTPCSGIWQTIWLETAPSDYLKSIKITPHVFQNSCTIDCVYETTSTDKQIKAKVIVYDKTDHSKILTTIEKDCALREDINIELNFGDIQLDLWTPEHPNLYDFTIEIGNEKVSSYFGMREFGISTPSENNNENITTENSNEINDKTFNPRLTLNGKVLFMSGLLDQGYWPESNLTPPSEEAMISELTFVKECGFNMIRKHIKYEPLLFYYHCDRLGLIVWQDIVNGAAPYSKVVTMYTPFVGVDLNDSTTIGHKMLHRSDENNRHEFEGFIADSIDHLYNVVSIGLWTLFNEGWGQFDSARLTRFIREVLDRSRPIDSTSGWFDQEENVSNFLSLHIYFKKISIPENEKRAIILSEFGGYSLKTGNEHMYSPDSSFGYKQFDSPDDLKKGLSDLYRNEVMPCIEKGLCATVYTQLTDVENEINGLVSYDRKVKKIDPAFLCELNSELYQKGNL